MTLAAAAEEGVNLLLDRINEGEHLGTRTGTGGRGRLAVRHKGRAADLRGPQASDHGRAWAEWARQSTVTSAESTTQYKAFRKKKKKNQRQARLCLYLYF